MGEFAEDGVGNSGVNPFGTVFVEDFGRRHQGAGGFGHVIDEQDIAAHRPRRSHSWPRPGWH
jgi:hypothetical protein